MYHRPNDVDEASPIIIRHAAMTDRGLLRTHNEDAWAVDSAAGLYLVADGMGGHTAGALAAKSVVEMLPPLLRQRLRTTGEPPRGGARGINRRLRSAIAEVSRGMYSAAQGRPGLEGMGATLVMAMIRGRQAHIAHVGDSRAYLLRAAGRAGGRAAGELRRLTRDHSVVQVLIDHGLLSEPEAAFHPQRGRITRNVGMPGHAAADVCDLPLQDGDRLLLCTDGLNGMIDDDLIRRILAADRAPDQTCQRLIEAANSAGGDDNITVLVIDAQGAEGQ